MYVQVYPPYRPHQHTRVHIVFPAAYNNSVDYDRDLYTVFPYGSLGLLYNNNNQLYYGNRDWWRKVSPIINKHMFKQTVSGWFGHRYYYYLFHFRPSIRLDNNFSVTPFQKQFLYFLRKRFFVSSDYLVPVVFVNFILKKNKNSLISETMSVDYCFIIYFSSKSILAFPRQFFLSDFLFWKKKVFFLLNCLY